MGNTVLSLGALSEQTWPGQVGIDRAEIAPIDPRRLDEFYVRADPMSPTRCIDGRPNAVRREPMVKADSLGPQVPGGAPGSALAYRLAVDDRELSSGTFAADARTMVDAFNGVHLQPGAHRDDQGRPGRTGCRSLDDAATILRCLSTPELVADNKRWVRTLLREDFNRDHYLRVLGASVMLSARAGEYFADRLDALDHLEEHFPGSVSVLSGTHAEHLFVVNEVRETTLDTDWFASVVGVQAFGFDLWRTRLLARRILPLEGQQQVRERFLHARVMLTVATLMALTDGSLPLWLRTPQREVS